MILNRAVTRPLEPQRPAMTAFPSPIRISWREALVFCFVAWLGGQLIRSPYLGGPVVVDDLDFLATFGLVRQGKLSFFYFMMATAGPHPLIFWKIVYYGQGLLLGASPALFRVAIGVVQAVSGLTLLALLGRYTNNRPAAWFGSLLWALSAIGGWDNPLSVMAGGFIAWGVLWLLLGMFCVSRLTDTTGWRWPLLLAACTSMTMLSWGILLAVLPALPLQYLLLEHRAGIPPRRLLGWALAWLAPMVVVGALQVSMILPEMGTAERQRDFSVVDVAQRIGGQLSMVAGNLVYGHAVVPSEESIWPKALVAVVLVVAVAALVRGQALRLLVVFAAISLVYLGLADSGGSEIDFANVVTSGRYLYIPTLFWCGACAALVARLWEFQASSAPARRRGLVVAGGVLLVLYGAHQNGVARSTRHLFDLLAFDTTERVAGQRQILLDLAAAARVRGERLRVPDLPVLPSPPSHVLWTVSAFEATFLPGELTDLEIVPADLCTSADLQQFAAALNNCRSTMVLPWAELLKLALTDFQAVAWLANFAGRDPERPLLVPLLYFTHGDVAYPADQVQRWGLSFEQPALKIASEQGVYREQSPETIARLESSAEPTAQSWVVALRQIAQQPVPPP